MTPEQTPTRKVERSPDGLEIKLRAPLSTVVTRIISQLILALAGWYGLKWARAALSDWTTTREIHGLLSFLDEQEFSDRTILWILYAAIGLSAYLIVAGIIDVLIRLTRRDRIILRPSEWLVKRSALGIVREKAVNPRGVALELASFDRALIARSTEGAVTITNLGTDTDRTWLKDELEKLGTTTGLLLIPVGSSRVIATVKIDRRSDGTTLITQTKAAKYGCPVIFTLIVVTMIIVGVVWQGGPCLSFGLFFSIVAIFLWLSINDHEELTINSGSIRWRQQRWRNRFLGTSVKQERTIRDSALFVTASSAKSNDPNHSIEAIDGGVNVSLLTLTGPGSREDASTIMAAIAEASGFPVISENEVRAWREEREGR